MTQRPWDPQVGHVWPGTQPPQSRPPAVKPRGIAGIPYLVRILIVVGVAAVAVIVVKLVPTTPATRTVPWPPIASLPPTAVAPAGPLSTFSDGVYEVGRDVVAGTFVAPGGRNCYWSRSSDASGDSIIANEWSPGKGQVIATAKAGEYLKVSDCGTWTKR